MKNWNRAWKQASIWNSIYANRAAIFLYSVPKWAKAITYLSNENNFNEYREEISFLDIKKSWQKNSTIIDSHITLVMKIITGNKIITSGVINTKIHKNIGFFRSFIVKNKVKSRPRAKVIFYKSCREGFL